MNSEELVVDSNLEAEIHAMEPHGVTFKLKMPEGWTLQKSQRSWNYLRCLKC